MREWETVVEIMARASDIEYERIANGVRALISAGYTIVPREVTGKIISVGVDAFEGNIPFSECEFAARRIWDEMLAAGEVKPEEESHG